jgi:hypothetical protein
VGQAFVTRAMAEFGEAAVAGMAIVARLTPVAFGVIFALSGAVGPIIGQNAGAGEGARVRRAYRDALLFTAVVVVPISLILFLLRGPIVALFDAEGVTVELVYLFCGPLALAFFFNGMLFVSNAAFNNLGHPFTSTLLNWGRHTLGTILPVILFAGLFGATGRADRSGGGGRRLRPSVAVAGARVMAREGRRRAGRRVSSRRRAPFSFCITAAEAGQRPRDPPHAAVAQFIIDEGPLVAGQPRDAGIDRLGPVVENGCFPPGRGVEEPARAGLSELRQVALDHGIEVAEQDRMFVRPVGVVLGLGAVDMHVEAPLGPVIMVDLDHRVPVIGVFPGIERGPVRARHGGDQPLDLLYPGPRPRSGRPPSAVSCASTSAPSRAPGRARPAGNHGCRGSRGCRSRRRRDRLSVHRHQA